MNTYVLARINNFLFIVKVSVLGITAGQILGCSSLSSLVMVLCYSFLCFGSNPLFFQKS
jgi:hypothetical protein